MKALARDKGILYWCQVEIGSGAKRTGKKSELEVRFRDCIVLERESRLSQSKVLGLYADIMLAACCTMSFMSLSCFVLFFLLTNVK